MPTIEAIAAKLPCQVCGRMLTVQRSGLTKPHKRTRGSEDYCSGTGYRQARWPVGQRLQHHAGSVWVVKEDRGGQYGNYLIRCPDGQKSLWRDEWIEEPGKTIVAHGEYMHRHGWTPIESTSDETESTTSEQAAALRATYEPSGSRSFEGKADSED